MGIAEDIVVEHGAVADTLEVVGPHAPAGVGSWTAEDLAAHLLSQTMGGGVIVFIGRSVVARGVRINDRAGSATERTIRFTDDEDSRLPWSNSDRAYPDFSFGPASRP